jgi:hypothetical protein
MVADKVVLIQLHLVVVMAAAIKGMAEAVAAMALTKDHGTMVEPALAVMQAKALTLMVVLVVLRHLQDQVVVPQPDIIQVPMVYQPGVV